MDATSLAVFAVGLSVFALLVVLAMAVKVGRLLRAYDGLLVGDEQASFTAAVGRQTAATQALRRDVLALRGDVAGSRGELARGLRHVAVVRYDAFGDMGGQLSFTVALLDDAGDGLVLTSINGRSETRTYAKGVQAGSGEQPLSPEELEAVERATAASPRATSAATGAATAGVGARRAGETAR